jgi:hypothetical protein
VRSNRHFCQIVDPEVFPQPGILSDVEIPGKLYSETRLDVYAFADFRAKYTEQAAAEGGGSYPMRSQ